MNQSTNDRNRLFTGKISFNILLALFVATTLLIGVASCKSTTAGDSVAMYPNDLVSENISGPVTAIETEAYFLDSAGNQGAIDEKYVVKYDSSGFVTSITTTNGNDSVKTIATYAHNANGLLTQQIINDGNDKKTSSLMIDYDSTGKPTIAKSYDSTGKMDTYFTDIGLNKYGKFTGATGYHPDSTLKMSFSNDYDSVHYLGGVNKDSVGKITYSSTIELDSSFNPSKIEEATVALDSATKRDVTKKSTTINTYSSPDSHGNWMEQREQVTGDDTSKKPHVYKRRISYRQ